MKSYKKNRFKGFEPVAEITYHKRKGYSFHVSYIPNTMNFIGFLTMVIHDMQNIDKWNKNAIDTAKPSDRKRLNKKNG